MKTSALVIVGLVHVAWGDPAAKPPKQPTIPTAAAALIPDPGYLVATRTDNELVITRITKTGPKELGRTPHEFSGHAIWIDSKTLVTVNVDYDKNVEVRWLVDGVVDAKRTVKHAAAVWGLKNADETLSVDGAYRAADGAIWLSRCIAMREPDCVKWSWLRVDTAAPKTSRTKPAKLVAMGEPLRAPDIKAPAGFSGKITKLKGKNDPKRRVAGIECKGPKGTITWSEELPPIDPAERFTPKKVRWILATPALFEVEGEFVNPVAQTDTVRYVFRDCGADPIEWVAWVGGDHAWSYSTRDDDFVHVLVDDMPVALLVGHDLLAAPPPPSPPK